MLLIKKVEHEFLNQRCYFRNLRVVEFSKFSRKERGGSYFPHKNGGVAKIDRVVIKKEKVSLIFITHPFQCYLSLSV